MQMTIFVPKCGILLVVLLLLINIPLSASLKFLVACSDIHSGVDNRSIDEFIFRFCICRYTIRLIQLHHL